MVNEKKELAKFMNNPEYRYKVIAEIHKKENSSYSKRINVLKGEIDKLSKRRSSEISRINKSRWEKISHGKLLVNRTEGKIKFNDVEELFSSIQGAEIKVMFGTRVVTIHNFDNKSRKHASLGGAVVGGAIAGPIGAVAGGVGLGKTKGKITGTTVSNEIPTCTHLGVMVNIDGFLTEIVLIGSQVDQSSRTFSRAQSDAQTIVSTLNSLAKTPVPQSYLKPEEEASVKNIDAQLEIKYEELQKTIADSPTYSLPEIYRTEDSKNMSDEEYLSYLHDTDSDRVSQRKIDKAAVKIKHAELKAAAKAMREEDRNARLNSKITWNINVVDSGKKLLSILYSVIFWLLSIALLSYSVMAFQLPGGMISGFIFLITAVAINPLVGNMIRNNLFELPKWGAFIIFVIGFIVATLCIPVVS